MLVDGVDELPDDGHRDDARRWLADLAGTFPRGRFLVTSRSTAAGAEWLHDAGFRTSTLEPMDLADIDTFVVHWHDAVRAAPPDQAASQKVRELGERLRFKLRERQALRGLAATPLLAAMMCAPHVERWIPGAELLPLREESILLRDLAGWRALNSYVDVDAAVVRRRVEDKLESMPRVRDVPAGAAYRYLMERSGILRTPVEGRVDFVHRTFQEYLAAHDDRGRDRQDEPEHLPGDLLGAGAARPQGEHPSRHRGRHHGVVQARRSRAATRERTRRSMSHA